MLIAVHHCDEAEACFLSVSVLEREADLLHSAQLGEHLLQDIVHECFEFSGGGLARLSGRNSDVAHVDVVHFCFSSCVRGGLIYLFDFELI